MPQRDYKIENLNKKRPRGIDPLWTRAAFIVARMTRVKPPYDPADNYHKRQLTKIPK